jgi:excisionase family DNA binding protein
MSKLTHKPVAAKSAERLPVKAAPSIQFAIEDHIFSVEDAAAHLRVSRSFVYELAADKKIKFSKIGKRTVVTGREMARFVKNL